MEVDVLGLHSQVLVAFFGKPPLCPTVPMGLLLAKAEPVSDGGSTSGVTELRRGKKALHSGSQ